MSLPEIPYYYIEKRIGAGGTAEIFRGVDFRSGSLVAIKSLFPSRSKDDFVLQKFREEAVHYVYLDHPNLTKLVDFVDNNGRFYLIMEYIEGYNLEAYINTVTGPLPEERVIPLFLEILDTIAYLHQEGILHLDLKPANIMITKTGNIKILDMGIASKLSEICKITKKVGSPAFMSPEQIRRINIGRHSDVFSLGVTLFSMITAHLPFSGSSRDDVFRKILHEPIPNITDFYPGANIAFQPIIEKAVNKKPSQRYQTCEEFERDILQTFKY